MGDARVTRLGKARGDGHVAGLKVAGAYLGYWIAWRPSFNSSRDAAVLVLDTRRGRPRQRGDCGPVASYACQDLVMARTGAVGWTNYDAKGGAGVVWKSDATGDGHPLDEDPVGPIKGLALSGSTLYWTNQGVPHSATLR